MPLEHSLPSRFRALPPETQLLLLLAALLQAGARAALAIASVPRVVSITTRLGAAFTSRQIEVAALPWVLAASSARVGGSCLTQALAARVLYSWAARPSTLIIGARRLPAPLEAYRPPHASPGTPCPEFHAWTEVDGVPVTGAADALAFVPLTAWS